MTWTAPEIGRRPSAATGDERSALEGALDLQRQTLLWMCGGLTGEQLCRRSVGRSGLSLLGIVRHLAEVERTWFRSRFLGEDTGFLYYTEDDPNRDFDELHPDRAESDFATYVEEVEAARAAVADVPLDQTFHRPGGELADLRWVYLHLIVEYAQHNGHASLLREHIDGRTGH